MALRKADLTDYLTAHGLVVEGDETVKELDEAYHYMREHEGNPVRVLAKAA